MGEPCPTCGAEWGHSPACAALRSIGELRTAQEYDAVAALHEELAAREADARARAMHLTTAAEFRRRAADVRRVK